MSTDVYLDPDLIAPLEPWEVEGRGGSGISPFAIPKGITVEFERPGLVSSLAFDYSGGEKADATEVFDRFDGGKVTIELARHTHKILDMKFNPPVDSDGLQAVANKLEGLSDDTPIKAKRFSFQMISRVLCKWGGSIANGSATLPH